MDTYPLLGGRARRRWVGLYLYRTYGACLHHVIHSQWSVQVHVQVHPLRNFSRNGLPRIGFSIVSSAGFLT